MKPAYRAHRLDDALVRLLSASSDFSPLGQPYIAGNHLRVVHGRHCRSLRALANDMRTTPRDHEYI